MNKIKLYTLSIVLLSVVGLLILGVIEIALSQWISWQSTERRDHVVETEILPVTFRPNYQGKFWNIEFQTNSFGFRDEPEIPLTPPAGEFRILSLGDSIGFGLGIPSSDHYTKVAQRIVNQKDQGRDVRIINAGGMGYSPSSYYVWLKNEGIELKPHAVVVEIELCNDVTDEALLGWKKETGQNYPSAVRGGRYLISWDGNLLGTQARSGSFIEKTYLYTDLLRRTLNLMGRYFSRKEDRPAEANVYYSLGFDRYLLTQERVEDGWKRLFGALKGIRELLDSNDIPLIVMLMPSRYLYQDGGSQKESAQVLFSRASNLADQYGLRARSLAEAIGESGGASLFFDFAHLTSEGNRVVGEELAKQVEKYLLSAGTGEKK